MKNEEPKSDGGFLELHLIKAAILESKEEEVINDCRCPGSEKNPKPCTCYSNKDIQTTKEHVCGLQGFGAYGDICSACEER